MKQNFEKDIMIDINKLIEDFKKNGFKQIDLYYVENVANKIGIQLYPELLSYVENSTQKTVVWIKCQFIYNSEDELITICNWLKNEIFPLLSYVPFYDEDAYKYHFSIEKKEYGEAGFYLNPDYPDGYWENHTL